MVVLTGKTLGERQRELNKMVADVITNKEDFNKIKAEKETTDIDKLFKIDIASHCKDIDYILEVLKSGDSLYISRAIKAYWMYEDTYSHVINTENLHSNIFPYMSLKMKKKMLSTMAIQIENKDRAATFYAYCKKYNLPDIEFKFLNKTAIEFKMNVIKDEGASILHKHLDTQKELKNFVGNSFKLAKCCLESSPWQSQYICNNLRFLYSVSNDEYLDMMEKYESVDFKNPDNLTRLGIRISKDIIVKHRNRILGKPLLYINKLNKSMLSKHITADDAKKCITDLMPLKVKDFWNINIFKAYNYILDVIPMNEKWRFVKELFMSKYPNEEFEMTKQFYDFSYYEMLSVDEREQWALRHLDEQTEILGSGNDYNWYKFVRTDKALEELKKYIMKTPSSDKRSDMLITLVNSTRDQKDLIQVLNYYYDRHVNEGDYYKIDFITKVLTDHNVFDFNTECWDALDKLFHSLDIYTVGKYCSANSFKAVSICQHILHKKDIPQALMDFIALDVNYMYFNPLLDKLGKEKCDVILQYLINLFVEKIQPFNRDPHNKKLRDELRRYVHNISNLISCFKGDDKETPEIVQRFLDIDSPKCEQHKIISADDLFRFLKTDAKLAVDALTDFENTEEWPAMLNKVLRKLKTYFPTDIAQEYIKFFEQWLPKLTDDYSSHNLINGVVYGLFQLTDISFKKAFMEQYCPLNPKINYSNAGRKLLFVQEAICRFVGYSRPPVPMEYVFKYIKGDYTQYCLPIFNMYAANLPPPELIKFTEATLNSPLSVQKHGLRLAFKCFDIDQLKNLVLTVWKKTKNVSLRMIIYKALFDRIVKEEESLQTELYQAMKIITADLHQDDDDSVFSLVLSNDIPAHLLEDYLVTSWNMVIKLPTNPINIRRQINVISCMQRHNCPVSRDFLRKNIIEYHVNDMLEEKRLRPHKMAEINSLYHEKWMLAVQYICSYKNNEELEKSLELLRGIFKRCLDMWSDVYEDTFLYRKFYFNFVKSIKNHRVCNLYKNYWHFNVPVLQDILDMLLKSLPLKEIYLTVWDLQTTIYWRIISSDGDSSSYDRGDNFKYLSPTEISLKYANQIANFVKDLLEKRQFYTVFLEGMANSLNYNVSGTYSRMKNNEIFPIMFCESLVDLSMKETHLLALKILPTSVSKELRAPVNRVLKKINSFEDDEVQSFLYSNFVLVDYKYISI